MWKLIGSLQNSVFSSSQKVWRFRTLWKEALSKDLRCWWKWFWNLRWCVWAHRIGKKTPGRVKPIIVCFTIWRHRRMVYRKRKDCVNCRITLDLTKTCMDILKEAIDLARESDHISYAFADISWSLCAKLMVRSSFSILLMISITCRILYLFFVLELIY